VTAVTVLVVTEPTSEPTLANVIAALNEQAAAITALTSIVQQGFSHAMTEIAGTKADIKAQGRAIAELSSKTTFVEANQNGVLNAMAEHRGEFRSHAQNMQAFVRDTAKIGESVSRMAEDVAGIKADTAFVEGYVNDMHEAVQRHVADPNAHPNAA